MASASLQPTRCETLSAIADALEAASEATRQAARALRMLAEQAPASVSPDDDPILTTAEAAERLKRSPAFVRQRCDAGQIKAMKDGGDWRIRRSALEAYERRRTR